MGSSNKKGISFAINKDEFTTHSDLKDQPEFQERVAEILKQRKERRRREKGTQGPQLPGFVKKEEYNIQERKMTASEIKREAKLKKKYDDSKMKASMIAQYVPEKGKQIYFATIRKQAMKEELELDEAKISRTERKRINQERRKGKSKGAVHAFDVDETLFSHGVRGRPNVQVHVRDASGKRVQSLTNQQFNTHKLDPGHSYDFSEFRSAKKFSQTAAPNKRVIKKLKRLQKRGKNVHLITARDKFDNPEEFRQHFIRHGINIPPGNIHYTGGMRDERDIGKKKVSVAKGIAKMGKSSSIHMYDDAAKVHNAFEAEKKRNRRMRIKTHLAKPNKEGEVMTRSYQATKEDFELWIQDILSEGYDLSEYSVEDLYDIYEEIISDENVITIPYESPYKNINESLEEEVELSPYEYWREFISESEDDNDDEEGDDYEDDYIEEEIELTPYELWKLYSIQKNIQEQGQDEDDEDDGRSVLNPASEAKMKLNAHLKRQKRDKLAASLDAAADELRNS